MNKTSKALIEVEESTPNHWVGSFGDLVMIFAFEGSSGDVGHITAAIRQTERSARRASGPLDLLFVLPPAHAKPPSAAVRGALRDAAVRYSPLFGKFSIVVFGTGFGPAIHRAVAAGMGAFVPRKIQFKVHTNLDESLSFLLGATHPGVGELRAHCAKLVGLG